MSRFLCSAAARDRGESLLGTASRVERWLLVESGGPWGPRTLPQSREIDDVLLLALQAQARSSGARTLLARRSRTDPFPRGRRLFVADSRPGRERLLTRTFDDDELAGVTLPFDGDETGWEPAEALLGVCTHGRHDPCCAIQGRPVAAALEQRHPALTWEVSHLGGDRFAGNVLVLPWGHYLGQVTAAGAVDAVDAVLAGRRPDPFYRGRSCWPVPVQAALGFVAERLGTDRLDVAEHLSTSRIGDRQWRVELLAGDGPMVVEVEQQLGPASSLLTCHAQRENLVPTWNLLALST